MKTFTLNKIEHHQMMRYYDAVLDESEVVTILDEYDIERSQELLEALSDTDNPLHQEVLDVLAESEIIQDRWEWSDTDDIWTDRKGGYEVTFELVSVDDSDGTVETASTTPEWPFPSATLDETELAATWPFPSVKPPTTDTSISEIKNSNDQGEYSIKIYSRGYEVGIGTISKEQYDFWEEQDEYTLGEALNQNIDYEEIECPEEAQFTEYYNEYSDAAFIYGPDSEYSSVEIKSPSGEVLYDGSLSDLVNSIENKLDDGSCIKECIAEDYISDLEPGHYVMWEMNGKGLYYEGNITVDGFDLSKLKFFTKTIENTSVIDSITYDGEEIYNHGGDWVGKYSVYTVHHVE